MASAKDKIECLKKARDNMAASFLTERLAHGKTITIPSLEIQIVPLKCGECETGVKTDGATIICGPMLNDSETICVYGKGKSVEKENKGDNQGD